MKKREKRWEEQKEMNKKMEGKMVKEKRGEGKKMQKWSKKKGETKKEWEKRNEVFWADFLWEKEKLKREKNFKRNFQKSFEIKDDYLIQFFVRKKEQKKKTCRNRKKEDVHSTCWKNPTSL